MNNGDLHIGIDFGATGTILAFHGCVVTVTKLSIVTFLRTCSAFRFGFREIARSAEPGSVGLWGG